jgi:hypothetical protein
MISRLRLGKRHMELMRIIAADNHGHAAPTPEHYDLMRWGYITITNPTADAWEYVATIDGRNAERTWTHMKEPE